MTRHRALPLALGLLGGLGLLVLVVLPVAALAVRAPWSDLEDLLGDRTNREALRLSLVVSLWALAASVLVGFPIAWLLARVEFPGRAFVRALITLPMVVPPVVGGVALLVAFGRRGLVGQWLDQWFDVRLAYTTTAAVLAATFVSLPFFVVTVESALRAADRRPEDAARTLGARPGTVLWRVTLPGVRGAIGAGAALAWARALGEFGATITFAGSFEGRTQTMPLAISKALERDVESAILLSLGLLAVAVVVLVALRERWWGRARWGR
ncbi:MAG: ABC transporter permease [Acidimicrobiales bacterium]|nr:ABC transporter permease [Acidimicrobiales bacterium]